jgi:polynucleotide 5'-kinase involved in rRNA processing
VQNLAIHRNMSIYKTAQKGEYETPSRSKHQKKLLQEKAHNSLPKPQTIKDVYGVIKERILHGLKKFKFDQKKSGKMKRAKEPQKSVRILVLGDSGVGKSSLVTVFISAHFEENLSSLIPVAVSLSRTLIN